MKVVVDTNVMISSFRGGKPREILRLWCSGDITLCLNQAILDEYFSVLQRMGLDQEEELEEIIYFLKSRKNIEYCIGSRKDLFIPEDPEDDKFINCALELDAKTIISGDKHLLKVERVFNVEILNPGKFLEQRVSNTSK